MVELIPCESPLERARFHKNQIDMIANALKDCEGFKYDFDLFLALERQKGALNTILTLFKGIKMEDLEEK